MLRSDNSLPDDSANLPQVINSTVSDEISNKKNWSRRRFMLGGAALAGALSLAACGTTAPTATPASAPPVASKPSAAVTISSLGQKMPLHVGFMPYTDHIAVPLVTEKIGKDFKLTDVKSEKFQKWGPGVDRLKDGTLDVMFTFVPPLFTRFGSEEIPAKVVLLAHRNGLYIFSKNGLTKPQNLKGKVFAVPDKKSNYYVMAAKFLKDAGLTYDAAGADVRFVELALSDMGNAMRNGDIDAFIQSGPQSAVLEQQKVGQILAYSKDFAPDHLDCVVLMRNEIINKYSDVAQEFVTGIRKAISDFGLDQKNKTGNGIEEKLRLAAQLVAPALNADSDSVYAALKQPDSAIIFTDPEPKLKDFEDLQVEWNRVAPDGNKPGTKMSSIIEARFAR